MLKPKIPLFTLRIPHKGKNKGKYISFHYLRGWKARKIRKVQEISPQILIYQNTSRIWCHTTFPWVDLSDTPSSEKPNFA